MGEDKETAPQVGSYSLLRRCEHCRWTNALPAEGCRNCKCRFTSCLNPDLRDLAAKELAECREAFELTLRERDQLRAWLAEARQRLDAFDAERATLVQAVADMQRTIRQLADRVVGQAELLARRAER